MKVQFLQECLEPRVIFLKLLFVFQVPVGSPDEVDEIFDAISYSKGASVIRMLHDYIGDAVSTAIRNV